MLLFLMNYKNFSVLITPTLLNSGSPQVAANSSFTVQSILKPKNISKIHLSHGELHGTSAKRESAMILLINGKWFFKLQTIKERTSWIWLMIKTILWSCLIPKVVPGYNTPTCSALKHQELLSIMCPWENIISGSSLMRTSVALVVTILLSQEDTFFTSVEGSTNTGIQEGIP